MSRRFLAATVLGVGAVVVFAVGGWLYFTSPGGVTTGGAGEEANENTGSEPDAGPRTVDVPRCPLRVQLEPTFRREEVEHESPNLRLFSSVRATQIEIACRRADRGFDRAQFLEETLESVKGRYEGEIDGKRDVQSGPAEGWTTWRTRGGQMRNFNVLVRGRTIVTVHLFGPNNPETRKYNRRLVERRLIWPGESDDAEPPANSDAGTENE